MTKYIKLEIKTWPEQKPTKGDRVLEFQDLSAGEYRSEETEGLPYEMGGYVAYDEGGGIWLTDGDRWANIGNVEEVDEED